MNVICIPLRMMVMMGTLGLSPSQSFKEMLSVRFKNSTAPDAAWWKSTRWIRWLGLILGPLPQAIRLFSFQGQLGIIWAKIMGAFLLFDWIIGEAMLFAALRWRENRTFNQEGNEDADTLGLCFTYPASRIRSNEADLKNRREVLRMIDRLNCILFVLGSLFVSMLCTVLEYIMLLEGHGSLFLVLFLWYFVHTAILTLVMMSVDHLLLRDQYTTRSLSQRIVARFRLLGVGARNLIEGGGHSGDVAAITFFLLNLVLGLVTYYRCYDSYGSINQGWIVVFG